MLWFRHPDPEQPYSRGVGTAESLGDELETDEYAAKYLKAWFFNNALPNFLVSFEGIQTAELKRAKEEWLADHRGVANAHRVHFSNGKMNAVRLDSSFRDQQIPELRRLQRDTVVQVFGVPPECVGIIENSNRSTIDAASYLYVTGVEFPRVEFLRLQLQTKLQRFYATPFALECEVAVPQDHDRRLNVMRAMPGAFALNEWRSEAGYDPLPQFDGVFPPLALPGQDGPQANDAAPAEPPVDDDAAQDDDAGETDLEPEDDARALPPADPPWARQGVPALAASQP